MVIFLTIRNSPEDIRVEAATFYRDIGMYIFATLTTILFAAIGKITIVFLTINSIFLDNFSSSIIGICSFGSNRLDLGS